jgi:AbrB family looped-hinge helix DNA binding protein
MRSAENTGTINERGMVTIPLEIRKKFGLTKGSKVVIMEIDGKIEFIPLRSVEEMETACTIKIERMAQIYDETHENELRLENKE